MTLIHTPRVLASIARGMYKKSPSTRWNGLLPGHAPHVYHARAGLFDVDYLGHMNNAASLTHAEYARWEWTAHSGMLQEMYQNDVHFMVTAAVVRFRRQVRPVFRHFQIETSLKAVDDDSFWVYQTFRYPEAGNDRVRTQVLIKGVAYQHRQVLAPRIVLEDMMGVPTETVEQMMLDPRMESSDSKDENDGSTAMQSMLTHFQELDESFRDAAGADDATKRNDEE